MSGDYSRYGYDPRKNYATVLLEQGRPLTDRDWNELALSGARRDQVTTLDVHGALYMSAVSSGAFAITSGGSGDVLIGRGRLYVDGLLIENHGAGALVWDSVLAAAVGRDPVSYKKQPYSPKVEDLPTSRGPYVIYLDAWQREVTQFTDPELVESALGIDTTTRLQTVWQVKWIDLGAVTATTDFVNLPKWKATTTPSAGRLGIKTASIGELDADPLLVPASSGYRGLENQLYRIEIHDGGAIGQATFKWSRENASVQARVTKVIDNAHLVVDSIGKDELLRFSNGDWIEVVDDVAELAGVGGQMTRIKIEGGVDERARVIAIEPAIVTNSFQMDTQGRPDPSRHVRIRRWDQKNKVFDSAGVPIADLSAPGSKGTIPVSSAMAGVHLEDGIVATFSLETADGKFKAGDYWTFAARANDASVESFEMLPPRGIHHHYALLAIYKPGAEIVDLRPKITSIPEIAARVAKLERFNLEALLNKVTELQDKVADLQTKLSGLTTSVPAIDRRLTTIEETVTGAQGVSQRLQKAEGQIDAIQKATMVPWLHEARTIVVHPPTGPVGEKVTILGKNFLLGNNNTARVQFGNAAVTQFVTPSTDTEINARVPALPAGDVKVTVTNAFGSVTWSGVFKVTV